MNLPKSFLEKMQDLLGEGFQEYLDCFSNPRWYGLRVNTKKISVEDFLKISPFSLEPIPWIENGFYYDGEKVSPGKHPYYSAGLYYLQEPSAMTPANRLPIEAGDRVLDLCAAPGGKATELGAKLKDTGILIANDISNSRAKGLLKNLELFGIGNMMVLSEEPSQLQPHFFEYFDKILIDAPCSGEGMFRKEKKMQKAWEEHGPEFFVKIQKNILQEASLMLKPGGKILYSTCTFDRRENEAMIEEFLASHSNFSLGTMKGYEGFTPGTNLNSTFRIYPHKMKGEGHFLALLEKEEEDFSSNTSYRSPSLKNIPSEILEFWKQISWDLEKERLEIHQEKVYYMPTNSPNLPGARFLRTGLYLGEWKKKRFEPSQALAMYLKKEEYDLTLDFNVEDLRVEKYLKGETLEVDDMLSIEKKGWYLVCVDGYPLGFGKVAGGILKNKYLPGWRKQS